jgi:hypothetical protein
VFPKAIAAPGVLFSCLYNVSGPLQASPNLFYPQHAPASRRPPAPLAACRGTWTRSISSSTSLPASLGADNPLNALPRSTDPALARTVSRRSCGPAVTQSTSPNHCPTSSTSYTWLVGPLARRAPLSSPLALVASCRIARPATAGDTLHHYSPYLWASWPALFGAVGRFPATGGPLFPPRPPTLPAAAARWLQLASRYTPPSLPY